MKRIATLLGYLLTLILMPCLAFAEDAALFSHIQPKLPSPGHMMELHVKLQSKKKFGLPLTLHLVRDGKLIRLRLPEGLPDIDDLPVYVFKVLAPVQTMSYTFYAEDPDKPTLQSKRFIYSRDCVSMTETVTIPKVPDYPSGEKIGPIAEMVRSLEFENLAIENSILELKEIEQLLTELRGHE